MPESPAARIDAAFASGREHGRALVMPFFVCGYPDGDTFVELITAAADAGAAMVEIGIPFSDPIMDGPLIQEASAGVLARGQTVDDALALMERASTASGIPLLAMTYYNIPFRRGIERAAASFASAGASGAILPDLSVEDSAEWVAACADAGIAPVFIAAETSTDERLRALGKVGGGFVYAASLLGVTGVRSELGGGASELVTRIRETCDLPVAVGIGVSTPAQAAQVSAFADGVIVGSAVVRQIADSPEPVAAVGELIRALVTAAVR